MGKVFVLKANHDCVYLQEVSYVSYEERYQKTKGIDPMKIYEVEELNAAYKKIAELNML